MAGAVFSVDSASKDNSVRDFVAFDADEDDVKILFLTGAKLWVAIGLRGVCNQRQAHLEIDGAFDAIRLGDQPWHSRRR